MSLSKMNPSMVIPKRPRHVVARELVDEYYNLTKTKSEWPRTNQQLAELTDKITTLHRKKKTLAEIKQCGYIIDEAFSGSDKYIRFIPRGKHHNHFTVNDLITIITEFIPKILLEKPTLKINALYNIDMYLARNPDITRTTDLKAISKITTRSTDLEELAKDLFQRISRNF